MSRDGHIPYSRKGLEDLAVALGVNSAYLWVDPNYNRLDIRTPQRQASSEDHAELEEDE